MEEANKMNFDAQFNEGFQNYENSKPQEVEMHGE